MDEYHRLDFGKLSFSNDVVTFDKALLDVSPLTLSNNIISGERELVVIKAKREHKNKRVQLEMYY